MALLSAAALVPIVASSPAQADPTSEMVARIESCLIAKAAAGVAFPDVLACVSDVDRACRLGEIDPELSHQDCWDRELEAWEATRRTRYEDLRQALATSDPDSPALTALAEADAAWTSTRYADCAFLSLRWRGTQATVESFTCPIEAEARRAATYSAWLDRLRAVEGEP